jgi:hypothetical protein
LEQGKLDSTLVRIKAERGTPMPGMI